MNSTNMAIDLLWEVLIVRSVGIYVIRMSLINKFLTKNKKNNYIRINYLI